MPLHYVDPNKKHGRWYTALESFGRSRPGQFWARHFAPRMDPWLYRKTGGRYPWIFGGVSTAPLVTTGAKSGQRRENQITYFHDGPDPIVTASNYGGPKHPQWYHNLKAHPDCELGGEKFLATEVTDPEDYARVYGLAEQVYAGWSDYRLKTDPIGRHIPVFRLKPRQRLDCDTPPANGTVIWTLPGGQVRVATPGSALLFPSLCVPTARLTISEIRHQPARTRFAKMPRRTHTRVDTIAKERRDNHKHRTQ